MVKRNTLALFGILGIVLLVLFWTGGLPFAMVGSGSGWQFDYTMNHLELNGEKYVYTDSGTESDTYNGAGGGYGNPTFDVLGGDAYSIIVDADDDGPAPDVSATMSQPYRVSTSGMQVPWNAIAEIQHTVGSEILSEYYYDFTCTVQTHATPYIYTSSGGGQIVTAECGSVSATVSINVFMQDTIFGDTDGEFMDAQVTDTDYRDLQLQSGLDFIITPKVDIPASNTAVQIKNRLQTQDTYQCTISLYYSMSSGLVRSGANHLPYDVAVTYTIHTTLLMSSPLVIGSQGEPQIPSDAPTYTAPFDIRAVALLVGAAVFVLALFFIFIRFGWSRRR